MNRILGPMADDQPSLTISVDGNEHDLDAEVAAGTLLDFLRDGIGSTAAKDGCSPQGQCGCCTVLVNGKPRVACVTPMKRLNGASVVTAGGLDKEIRDTWLECFLATGASQCGFCTPGVMVRLEATPSTKAPEQPLVAQLCRCTGWQTISEAWELRHHDPAKARSINQSRDLSAAGRRATIEGGAPQVVGLDVGLGQGGFGFDTAPDDALVAVPDGNGGWALGETLAEARRASNKIQGRRTTVPHTWPLDLPDGSWDAVLRTTWVEPAYLEPDAAWCAPGGEPGLLAANGGAFGAKVDSPVLSASRTLADEAGRTVLVVGGREDVTRWGPKRPPVAAGMNADGTGVMRFAATEATVDEMAKAILSVAPGLSLEAVAVPGPPTSASLRAAGWAEAVALAAGARGLARPVVAPNGAEATATFGLDESCVGPKSAKPLITVSVSCGQVLDEVVLRSYCIGAAHMAWSWLTSEALAVSPDGNVLDLTIRSFGILRAIDTPTIVVDIVEGDGPPINGSDAVFAAVAAAGWLSLGSVQNWPIVASV